MGAQNDIVRMVLCSLFENVIDNKAGVSDSFHLNSHGLKWLTQRLQTRIRS